MANENENSPPGSRRQRPPTVIDLPATEVPSAAREPSEASAPPPSGPPPPPRVEPDQPANRRSWFALAGGALAGAAGGLLVALLFLWFGAFADRHEAPADPEPRLAAIERQLKDLAARPVPTSVDAKEIGKEINTAVNKEVNKAVDDVAARLARLESAQATPRAPVTDPVVLGRLNAAEGATKSLADNIAALSRRAEATDAVLRDINANIGKLTAALADVRSTARAAAAGSDHASRLAVAAFALRNAVEHGDPFAAVFAIVRALAPDANAIAALEPFAATGVPGNAALGRELVALIRPVLRASETTAGAGDFLHRLQANAEKLVRIRPVGGAEPRGDDHGAISARAEQRAAQGDVAGAMAELAKLPADARTPFQAWIARAVARDKALDAGRRLAADAVAALRAAP